jgi:ABC-type sugar transport system permease subunit
LDFETLHRTVLYLPVITTVCAVIFSWQLFARYRAKGGGLHLLWWGIGMVTYGIGTFTEAFTTIRGWDPLVFASGMLPGPFSVATLWHRARSIC